MELKAKINGEEYVFGEKSGDVSSKSECDCSVSNREKLDYMIETMIGNASVRTLRGRVVPKKDAIHIAKKIMDLAITVAVSEVKQNVEVSIER